MRSSLPALLLLSLASLSACTSATCDTPPAVSDELLPYADGITEQWRLFTGQACVHRVAVDDSQVEAGGVWFAHGSSTVFMTEAAASSAGSAIGGARVGFCLSTLGEPAPANARPYLRSNESEDEQVNATIDEALLCSMGRGAVSWHAEAMSVCHPGVRIRSNGLWGPLDVDFGGQSAQRAPADTHDLDSLLEPGATFLDERPRWDGMTGLYLLVDDGRPTPTPWFFDWSTRSSWTVNLQEFEEAARLPGVPAAPEPFVATTPRAIQGTEEGFFTVDELIAIQHPGTDDLVCEPLGGSMYRIEGLAVVEVTPDNVRISVY